MQKYSTNREKEKIKELFQEYSSKGFRVVKEPGKDDLPDFMKSLGFRPDLIVYGEEQSLVIEVKTSQSIRQAKEFAHIADFVRRQEGWDFMLVLTNPASQAVVEERGTTSGSGHATEQLEEAERLMEAGRQGQFYNASLLIAWAGLEAALRYALSTLYQKDKPITPETLVRNSIMYGVISRNDANIIESIMEIRNSVAHGYEGQGASAGDVAGIVEIGKRVLAETNIQLEYNQEQ